MTTDQGALDRELGVGHAVLLGLGSIVGTGVFVSTGLAAGVAGPAVVLAVVLAAAVAACNGLSSAQLAAVHPTSGGTYEYGNRELGRRLGFAAGWTFLLAKSASAATAALGFGGYLAHLVGAGHVATRAIAAVVVVLLTILVVSGIRRSAAVNAVIVSVALGGLAAFVVATAPAALANAGDTLRPFFDPGAGRGPLSGLLEGTALMFVAFTGYGRIATLGEEVREPRHTIPRAIVATLVVSAVLYAAVTLVGTAAAGSAAFADATRGEAAPLELIARQHAGPAIAAVVALAALVAMGGVLLNLLLGLSRVVLAMARRSDLPAALATLDGRRQPTAAVLLVGGAILALSLLGSVEVAWSFSAFTVLVYYAITNLTALRLGDRRFLPAAVSWLGLAGCLGLAFWVEPRVWLAGLAILGAGLGWHEIRWRVASAA